MPSPQTCAHCASAFAMTQEAFEKRIPPPDVVRGALLLGIAVGSSGMSGPDVRECAECRQQIDTIRKSIAMAAEQQVASAPQRAPGAPQPPPQAQRPPQRAPGTPSAPHATPSQQARSQPQPQPPPPPPPQPPPSDGPDKAG